MPLTAWIPRATSPTLEAELREFLDPGVDLRLGPEAPSPPTHAVLVDGRPDDEMLDASPNLETVIIPWAGVPQVTRETLARRDGIALHVLHHNAAPTAEMAVALLLAAARRVVPVDRALRHGDWTPRYEEDRGLLLDGRSALVLGHGAIGRRVARALVALGMDVRATRRTAETVTTVDSVTVHPSSDTLDLLGEADVVLCCLPDTPATAGLLDAAALQRVRPHAVLVNVGRGVVIDEAALWDALTEGRLGAVGLDVWWRYPASPSERAATPPGRFDWGSRDDVVLSPHRAGHCDQTESLRAQHLAASLNAASRGLPVPNPVALAVGA